MRVAGSPASQNGTLAGGDSRQIEGCALLPRTAGLLRAKNGDREKTALRHRRCGGEPAALCRMFHDHFFVSLLTNWPKWCIIFCGKRNGADEVFRLRYTRKYQKGKGVFDSGMKKASLSFFAAAGRLELCLHGRRESGNGMPNWNRQTEYWRFSRAVSGLRSRSGPRCIFASDGRRGTGDGAAQEAKHMAAERRRKRQ